MTAPYVVAVEGLIGLKSLEDVPMNIVTAAVRAVNKTADFARTKSSRIIQEQVNFRARYLTEADSSGQPRLGVTHRATATSVVARITARSRPTGLANFIVGSRSPQTTRKRGVRVAVKPGSTKEMRRAFLFRLKSGNVGLAVRTSGEKPTGAYKPLPIGKNLFLLYGPSVDQVFGGDRGVAQEVAPEAADYLEAEFLRIMGAGIL